MNLSRQRVSLDVGSSIEGDGLLVLDIWLDRDDILSLDWA